MDTYTSIAVFGSVAYDNIMNFNGVFSDYFHPEKIHQINVSFLVDDFDETVGGTGTNIAYNLSLVSDIPVRLTAGIGKDGRRMREFFERNKLDTSGLLEDSTRFSAHGKVVTDANHNQIWTFYYGACELLADTDISPYVPDGTLSIISANHKRAFLHTQQSLMKLKKPYVYDPAKMLGVITKDELYEGIMHATLLVGNDYEIALILRMLGIPKEDIMKRGIPIVTTLGAEGVQYEDTSQSCSLNAYPDSFLKDPTGAGDAWLAGFLTRSIKTQDVKHALAYGNALASFAIESVGASAHRPTRKEIEERAQTISD